MPASLTSGISTGVRISTVGARSSGIATANTSSISTAISSSLLCMNGCIIAVTWPGISAMVMSQATTIDAATISMIAEQVLAAVSRMLGRSRILRPL